MNIPLGEWKGYIVLPKFSINGKAQLTANGFNSKDIINPKKAT